MINSYALLKTLIIPPVLALALYLLGSYVLLPIWHRYRERATYTPLPTSLASSLPASLSPAATGAIFKLVQRLSDMMVQAAGASRSGRYRRSGEGSLRSFDLGDEELEEGIAGDDGPEFDTQIDAIRGERRLSRELESGFMDDSDSDEGNRRLRR